MSRPRAKPRAAASAPHPADLALRIQRWFAANARPLPWRTAGPRDPWASLISEVMAQQTQIARVAERFPAFLHQFPTPAHLARASSSVVMAAWAGLGYYRRARLLHDCAKAIVERHAGAVPTDPAALRALPGIGRYTAGAIASIALHQPEPIVDGNVTRVLMRVHAHPGTGRDTKGAAWAWARAGEYARAATSPALANEGLMELGATVCSPRAPRCSDCPLATLCLARRQGKTESIPAPQPRVKVSRVSFDCVVAFDDAGRVLLQHGGEDSLWPGLWRPPASADGPALLAQRLSLAPPRLAGRLTTLLSHRRVTFRVWVTSPQDPRQRPRPRQAGLAWCAPGSVRYQSLSNAHRRVVALAMASPHRGTGAKTRAAAPRRKLRPVHK